MFLIFIIILIVPLSANENADTLAYVQKITEEYELLKKRVEDLEKKVSGAVSSITTQPLTNTTSTQSVQHTAEDLYNQALELLKTKELEQSFEKFSEFLKLYPGHRLAEETNFWMGEILFQKEKFLEAQKHYVLTYKGRENSRKGDSLFKIAIIYKNLGKNDEAKVIFRDIISKFHQNTSLASQAQSLLLELEDPTLLPPIN